MSKPPVSWSVRLPALPLPELSLNRYLGEGGHWKRAEWREVQRDAWLALLSQASPAIREADDPRALFRSGWYPPPRFSYPVSIAIRLTGTGRKTDVQNWVSHYSLKILVDCLTEPVPSVKKYFGLGIIKNDWMRYVRAFSVEVAPDGGLSTQVTITEFASVV